MTEATSDEVVIPLAEERLRLEKREIVTGRVEVRVRTSTRQEVARETLDSESVDVERVAIGRFVDEVPAVREEGDVTIVPVFEEVVVKRLFLREEVRLTRRRATSPFEEVVELRREEAVIDRAGPEHPPA